MCRRARIFGVPCPVTTAPVHGSAASLPHSAPRARFRAAGNASLHVRLGCGAALVSADLVAFLVAQLVSWKATQALDAFWWPDAPLQPRVGLQADVVLLAGVMLFLAGRQHYVRRIPFWTELRTVMGASGAALLGSGFVQFSLQQHDSRLQVVLSWALFVAAVPAMRGAARAILTACSLWQVRVVVVGDAVSARLAADALLSEPGLGYRIAAVVSPFAHGTPRPGLWRDLLRHHRAELLALAQDDADGHADSLLRDGVPLAVVARTGLPVHGLERTSFISHDAVLFTYSNNMARPLARTAKVAFDLAAALLLLLLAFPVMLLVAAAVSLDGGPVLYGHRRLGARGRPFDCLKFRSMVPDADGVLRRLLDTDPAAAAEWAATQKLRHDPRVTRIGHFLRSTSLDELPQLLNVLRLEMSLVGPRPIVSAEVARYGDMITYYYEARPGLTGLWQVSGRSETGYGQRVRLDTWYVKNWSIWHDVTILARTVPTVLRRRGAR